MSEKTSSEMSANKQKVSNKLSENDVLTSWNAEESEFSRFIKAPQTLTGKS